MPKLALLDPPQSTYTFPPVAPVPLTTPTERIQKSKTGKRISLTEKELREGAKKYFDWCDINKKLPNLAGLAVFLDVERTSFYHAFKEYYPKVVKWILDNIQDVWIQRLGSAYATGAIFYLKNAFREDFKESVFTETGDQKPVPILVGLIRTINKNKKIEKNPLGPPGKK